MIKIVTDSTALLTDAVLKEFDIKVIPLNVNIGTDAYKDGIDMDGNKLIRYIKDNPKGDFPTTSQPSIGQFVEVYNELTQNGDTVLSLHMTDLLSGTVHAATQASEIADGDIKVVNTHYIDQSLGFLVVQAAKMAQSGDFTRDQIIDQINKDIQNSELYIGVSTLENLMKGGRISKATGIISKMMNLHVVFKLLPDDLKLQLKGRGKKTISKWFDQYLEENKGNQFKFIGISYTGSDEYPNELKKRLETEFPNVTVAVQYTSSIVSVHTGENAFAIMTCKQVD
ncbi:MAG: DegV family protein [Apilactobacillus sp.]|uniref:DegV family protein n=1 Tax=Apilactobacillus TaxID=2767877 RepID=UPI0025E1F8FA|nr:DegV family protein [Apilactobacillus sp.]MCT6822652.1 DegV family protein [Apilactobacillus sp.]MCT6858422.1 DegV family protein [Apilactobacillus sp.]